MGSVSPVTADRLRRLRYHCSDASEQIFPLKSVKIRKGVSVSRNLIMGMNNMSHRNSKGKFRYIKLFTAEKICSHVYN